MTRADMFRVGAAICKIKQEIFEAVRVAYANGDSPVAPAPKLPIPYRSPF